MYGSPCPAGLALPEIPLHLPLITVCGPKSGNLGRHRQSVAAKLNVIEQGSREQGGCTASDPDAGKESVLYLTCLYFRKGLGRLCTVRFSMQIQWQGQNLHNGSGTGSMSC